MKTRPFLSHKRQDQRSVIALKRVLAAYGVGGWRDLDDLAAGELSQPGFKHAIDNVTGGCIWYGTKRVLRSWYVNNVELPAVTARKRREPRFPLMPVFATVTPNDTKDALLKAAHEPDSKLTVEDVDVFMDANGRPRFAGESIDAMHDDVARRYVRSAVQWLRQDRYSVAMTALIEPAGTQDFTFDWRELIDPQARTLAPGAERLMRDALRTFRDVVRPTSEFPLVTVDIDAPLPMAALMGYEWRVTTRFKLRIRQRTGSSILVVDGDGDGDGDTDAGFPDWAVTDLSGTGPLVVAVSTGRPLSGPLSQYAHQVAARRTLELHLPGRLDADGIRGLGRHIADTLGDIANTGQPKHLLLAGPESLATLIGAGANATGTTTMPFWNGQGYVTPVTLGG